MNDTQPVFPVFDFVFGWVFFLSFVCFLFCLSTLRHHVDVSKLATKEEIDRAVRSAVPKREILTDTGKARYKTAIVSFLLSMATLAAIGIKNLTQ